MCYFVFGKNALRNTQYGIRQKVQKLSVQLNTGIVPALHRTKWNRFQVNPANYTKYKGDDDGILKLGQHVKGTFGH